MGEEPPTAGVGPGVSSPPSRPWLLWLRATGEDLMWHSSLHTLSAGRGCAFFIEVSQRSALCSLPDLLPCFACSKAGRVPPLFLTSPALTSCRRSAAGCVPELHRQGSGGRCAPHTPASRAAWPPALRAPFLVSRANPSFYSPLTTQCLGRRARAVTHRPALPAGLQPGSRGHSRCFPHALRSQ